MSTLQRHTPYSREEFENALSQSSRFGKFPNEWLGAEDKFFLWEKGKNIREYCYIIPLTKQPPRLLKIYSSVSRETGYSRDVGGDAIRIVLASTDGQPKLTKRKRINRTANWKTNLRTRISEVLQNMGFDTKCPLCGNVLFMRSVKKTGVRFLSCSKWEETGCRGKRNYTTLNEYI